MTERPANDAPAGPNDQWAPVRERTLAVPRGSRERLKDRMLGQRLPNEALAHERLGKPTALAVFSSDALSSTAYATEEILRTLMIAGGIGALAFSKVMPITIAMVGVLAVLMFSYRQTIKAYPSAGGAYIVTKDNLGLLPAQVAGVALLTDYVLTVAVSVSAGVAALYSALPSTYGWRVPIALAFIALIAWGNLRGVKESGRIFAAPTYGFILSVVTIIVVGIVKAATGHLGDVPLNQDQAKLLTGSEGVYLFLLLHAFASGGAAMTGVEAISNGVPAFRKPEWRNARSTLMVMGSLLGVMFLGLSWLASYMHVVPDENKTVISQIAKGVLGDGPQFFVIQLMTLLILVLAANTSFADFPRLASFHAEDAFMPRQLTKRGHRLAFSNGILFLAISAAFLVVLFQADVTRLIPLYAIGVFTSFTLSQLGMSIRHLKLREPKWRLGLVINGTGALATGVVTVVIAATKFTEGAWAVMLLVPILVMTLVRLNHQYEKEAAVLHSHEAGQALVGLRQPVPTTHVAVVFVDRLDAAAARALHVARTLRADRTEAVHLGIDDHRVEQVRDAWSMVAINGLDLRVIDVPDRDLTHAAQSFCARLMADGHTQVSVLIPRLEHRKAWHRILHDRTSERLADALVKLPNANVTFVPFHLGEPIVPLAEGAGLGAHHHHHLHLHHHDGDGAGVAPSALPPGSIGSVAWRSRAVVEGRVVELGVEQSADTPSLVVTVDDGTGRIDLLFLGRRDIGGVVLGARVRAEGMAAAHRHRLSMLNPTVDVLALPAHH